MENKYSSNFKTGMYLFETLTAGMYNEPLSIYREYIQNSVDSIDLLKQKVSPMLRKNIDVVINVLVALFAFLVMLVGGTWLVITRFQLDVNSAALHMPLGFVYLVMPISGLLIIFYSVLLIIHPKKESI